MRMLRTRLRLSDLTVWIGMLGWRQPLGLQTAKEERYCGGKFVSCGELKVGLRGFGRSKGVGGLEIGASWASRTPNTASAHPKAGARETFPLNSLQPHRFLLAGYLACSDECLAAYLHSVFRQRLASRVAQLPDPRRMWYCANYARTLCDTRLDRVRVNSFPASPLDG